MGITPRSQEALSLWDTETAPFPKSRQRTAASSQTAIAKKSAVRIYPGCAKYRPDLPKESFVDMSKKNMDAILSQMKKGGKDAATAPIRDARAEGRTQPIREIVLPQTRGKIENNQ